jgi:hypothetical protein
MAVTLLERPMKNKTQLVPIVLMTGGFGLMLVSIAAIAWGSLSDTAHAWAIILESFGMGLGGVGLGMFVALRKRQ